MASQIKRTGLRIPLVLLTASLLLLTACFSRASDRRTDSANEPKTPDDRPKISFLINDTGNPYAQDVGANDIYIRELSRLSGYRLEYEFIGLRQYDEQLAVRYSSGDLPDVVHTGGIEDKPHPDAVDSGAFLELGPLIDRYGPHLRQKIPPEVWDSPRVSKNGKIYGIPSQAAFPHTSLVVYYRQDWLERLGMKPPDTIEQYLSFFAAVKATDLNGNGRHDEIPFYVQENMGLVELFFGAFGVYPGVWRLRDGKLMPDIVAPEMGEAIKFYKELYDKGYINRDMFRTKSGDWFNNIYSGQAAMWMFWAENYQNAWAPELFTGQPDAKIGLLGGPRNAKGERHLAPASSGLLRVFVIPAKTKNPENIIKFFDWSWSDDPEKDKFFAFGIKDFNYTEQDGKPVWNELDPVNYEKYAASFYQLVLNPQGDGRAAPLLLDTYKYGDKIREAAQIADESTFQHEGMPMPALDSLKDAPELDIHSGSLFLDMFARAVTGKEAPEQAFAAFVAEWMNRGGEAAIEEATAWYNES